MMNLRIAPLIAIAALVFGAMLARAADAPPPSACVPPDASLLHSSGSYTGRAQLPDGEKIARYNEQARVFNECTRGLVDGGNGEIDKARDEANAQIRRITATANRRIDAIQAQMRRAMTGAPPATTLVPRDSDAFPDPDCRKADPALLGRAPRGSRDTALDRGERYEVEDLIWRSCVETYFQRAAAAAQAITDTANADIRRTADTANARIAALESTVKTGIDTARAAAAARSRAVEGTPLARNDPIITARNAANPLENENGDRSAWPVVEGTPTGEGNRREFTCRAPQQLMESRVLGPKVCRRNGTWAALRKMGKDISPDGRTIIDLNAMQSTNPAACDKNGTAIASGQGGYLAGPSCR
jgi:hypothetical protein